MRQKDVEAKEEIVSESVFNVGFFFLISLQACRKSLNEVNSLHYLV